MENINRENPRYVMAVERVQKIKKFYTGILVFAIVLFMELNSSKMVFHKILARHGFLGFSSFGD